MWRVAVGITLVVLGIAFFFVGLQYASFSVPLGGDDPLRARYLTLSAVFGYASYGILAAGAAITVWAIRLQNRIDIIRHSNSAR